MVLSPHFIFVFILASLSTERARYGEARRSPQVGGGLAGGSPRRESLVLVSVEGMLSFSLLVLPLSVSLGRGFRRNVRGCFLGFERRELLQSLQLMVNLAHLSLWCGWAFSLVARPQLWAGSMAEWCSWVGHGYSFCYGVRKLAGDARPGRPLCDFRAMESGCSLSRAVAVKGRGFEICSWFLLVLLQVLCRVQVLCCSSQLAATIY